MASARQLNRSQQVGPPARNGVRHCRVSGEAQVCYLLTSGFDSDCLRLPVQLALRTTTIALNSHFAVDLPISVNCSIKASGILPFNPTGTSQVTAP